MRRTLSIGTKVKLCVVGVSVLAFAHRSTGTGTFRLAGLACLFSSAFDHADAWDNFGLILFRGVEFRIQVVERF